MITGFNSNISDRCNIQKYNLELRRKLKAYTMYRFCLQLYRHAEVVTLSQTVLSLLDYKLFKPQHKASTSVVRVA